MPSTDYRIYSSANPIVHSGDTVKIDVLQTLTPQGGGAALLNTTGPSIEVQVQGPQVQISEADIVGVYPAANSTDSPDNYLPHIALSRRTLPWERIGPDGIKGSGVPWLALLVLTDADMRLAEFPFVIQQTINPATLPTTAASIKPSATLATPEVATIKPSLGISAAKPIAAAAIGGIGFPQPVPIYIQGSLTLQSMTVQQLAAADQDPATYKQLIKIPGITATTTINTLAIPAPTLKMLLPSDPHDLSLLCNVKEVLDSNGLGTFTSIVVSHRLPDAGDGTPNTPPALHTVVLVSLEQRTDIWTRFNNREFIKVVVLHAWTFTPSKGGDFREVCQLIRYAPNGGVLRFGNLPQVLPIPANAPLSAGFGAALNTDGYLIQPLDTAEPGNVIWRGPLRPFPPPPRSPGVAIRPAPEEWDQQPANTKLDYSHATAFELGKLLAIADAGIREDLREVHLNFNLPNKYFVAVNQLPLALQRPYWGIDWGDSLYTAQQALDNALSSPWQLSSQGAAQGIVGIANVQGQGDFTGVATIAKAQNWVDSVTAALSNSPASSPAQAGQIDLGAAEATLVANLAQQFPELVNAAIAHP